MSAPTVIPDPAVLGDLSHPDVGTRAVPCEDASARVRVHLLSSASTLGFSILVERGAGFLANILAARFGGASVFGAYSLGISTANNISTYAAGGIGATATRFSGKYNDEDGGYRTFAHVLTVVTLISAVVAVAALWLGAGPIAQLLHKPNLVSLLRWASLSAAGMIVVESARGFFVGQRRLAALALLSVFIGVGMVGLLPAIAATHHPTRMITAQGAITLAAVGFCLLLSKPLHLVSRSVRTLGISFGAMLREVWTFGFVQLSGLLSANLAGWWLTALVARADTSLVEMGFFAIASQLRNLTGVVPGLLTESSYAVMASGDKHAESVPDRVMALCTYASTVISFVLACVGSIVVPWLLHGLYGQRYAGAGLAAVLGMSVAMVQMGNAPPSARMSIVSIRWVAVGNTSWAVFVAIAGTALLLKHGSAAGAMLIFFSGHVLLASLVLVILHWHRHLPEGMVALFLLSTGGVAAQCAVAALRAAHPGLALPLSLMMTVLFCASGAGLYFLGHKHRWLAAVEQPVRMTKDKVVSLLRRGTREELP